MDIMSAVAAIPGAGPLLPYVALTVAICAAAATLMPRPATSATGLYPAVYAMVNLIGLNVGHARNAEAPAAPAPVAPAASSSVPVTEPNLNLPHS